MANYFIRNNMYTSKARDCPFHSFSHKKEQHGESYQNSLQQSEKHCNCNERAADQTRDANLEGERGEPPLERFIPDVQIKEEPLDVKNAGGMNLMQASKGVSDPRNSGSFSSGVHGSVGEGPLHTGQMGMVAGHNAQYGQERMTGEEKDAKLASDSKVQGKYRHYSREKTKEEMTEEELKALQSEKYQQKWEKMSEQKRLAKRAANAKAQKLYRQRILEGMTEEQRQAYRAAAAEAEQIRRRLRRESMTEEELKAFRAAAAETQRKKRQLQKLQMNKEQVRAEYQPPPQAVVPQHSCQQQQSNMNKPELNLYCREHADAERANMQYQMEKQMEQEHIEKYTAASDVARTEMRHFRKEYE